MYILEMKVMINGISLIAGEKVVMCNPHSLITYEVRYPAENRPYLAICSNGQMYARLGTDYYEIDFSGFTHADIEERIDEFLVIDRGFIYEPGMYLPQINFSDVQMDVSSMKGIPPVYWPFIYSPEYRNPEYMDVIRGDAKYPLRLDEMAALLKPDVGVMIIGHNLLLPTTTKYVIIKDKGSSYGLVRSF
jgi:hypothetical protein